VLAGVGIARLDRSRVVATLSGGEKERVGLATLLLRAPDLLLLDEPTNHLDVSALEWLEDYLARYNGALVVVSHDRQFLNRTVNQIWEIEEHTRKMKRYSGDYDAYITAKAAERARWEDEFERQQEEIRELRHRVRETARHVAHNRLPKDGDKLQYNFKGENVQHAISRNVRSAEDQLRRIEANPIEKPPKPLRFYPRFDAEPLRSDAILKTEGLAKRYGDRWLFRDLNFVVEPDARIIIAGPNGAGKTTLLHLLTGVEAPDAGEVRAVGSARLGYLSQEAREFPPEQTLLAAYKGSDPGPESNFVAALLAHGLFRLEDVTKTVGQLSAGQRRKLELARLMADCPNVLLLDEPTNYISLDVLEAFETAVLSFPGPVIAVSHDRWFIQRFGGAVWRLEEGRLQM
jgi:macrolide transport system ATP-binding/permease protein